MSKTIIKKNIVKRPDSNRTIQSKTITIERKNIRINIAKNGGRF
jgi:hypothetical protein